MSLLSRSRIQHKMKMTCRKSIHKYFLHQPLCGPWIGFRTQAELMIAHNWKLFLTRPYSHTAESMTENSFYSAPLRPSHQGACDGKGKLF